MVILPCCRMPLQVVGRCVCCVDVVGCPCVATGLKKKASFIEREKDFCIENFSAKCANKALCKAVLPWFSGLNVRSCDPASLSSALHHMGDAAASVRHCRNECTSEFRTEQLAYPRRFRHRPPSTIAAR